MTEYAHNLAGTVLKAYDDRVYFRKQFSARGGDDFYAGACQALDNIIKHATGQLATQWSRKELEAFFN